MKTKLFTILSVVVLLSLVMAACTTPTAAPTAVPATAVPAADVTATKPPPTATPIPKCEKIANAPTVAAGELGSPEKPLTITFVPSGDTGKITRAGTAIADCLSKMTGLNVKIEVGTSYAASIEAMGANKAQIGFLNTTSAILAAQKYGVEPAVLALRKYNTNDVDPDKADAGKLLPYYKGQFIASAASGIKGFADLKGKTFCFVDPTSASGYILPTIVLLKNGIDPAKDFKAVQNAGSHPNVAIAVYKGDCDAGVTFVNVMTDTAADLKTKYPDINEKVTIFAVTDPIPNDGMQFAKDLDPKIKEAVTTAMLEMAKDPGGIAMLISLYNYNALQKVDATVYDAFVKTLKDSGFDLGALIK